MWKVKGLEQYTSWNLRVPDCVFCEKYGHRHVHTLTKHKYTYIYKYMFFNMCVHIYMCVYKYICVYVCVFVFFCCVVPCHVVCPMSLVGWWVGCGVLLSACRCRGGPCPWSFVLRMMSILQRARAERSMIERRVGQCMECVVLAPFSKWVRSSGYFC